MTLENNRTFITPRNQRISRIDARPHSKYGKATPDSYGFEYPTMSSLVDAVISQADNDFPRRQYASGCSFDDIVWQQAIGASKNMDHTRRGRDMADDEKVLFDLVQAVADRLWALHEADRSRNDRLESELKELKGTVALLNTRLLAVDRHSFEANKKVNTELGKANERLNRHRRCVDLLQEKHNGLSSTADL
ncbi:hypothetical protein BDM02DRAFT_3190865 [Thelephora ganbajun]|uniref:Uncharacterized protein n=1 Tax=Thelephora ganbajun TaxID=370292 RepID=A0ACB6Z472_THEGA|nr:hypothetical protein BDM02DRAFT_3190865 [Thelephora ganbajun]